MKQRIVTVAALLLSAHAVIAAAPPIDRAAMQAKVRVLDLDKVVFNTEAHPLRRTW
jgi:hypothetical protein